MTAVPSPYLLIFVDGWGLGQALPDNPLADAQTMPFLSELLGALPLAGLTVDRGLGNGGPDGSCAGTGAWLEGLPERDLLDQAELLGSAQIGSDLPGSDLPDSDPPGSNLPSSNLPSSNLPSHNQLKQYLRFQPIDACLGVPGLPQSATGQTTLYTGHNAAKFRGRHQSAFANGSLRQLIEPYGIFRQVMNLGLRATQANAYLPGYFEAIAQRRRRYAVGALLNLTAPVPFRTLTDYRRGEAIYWDVTGEIVERYCDVPAISEAVAGQRLLRLAAFHHFTLFETFMPDYAGHRQDQASAIAALQRIDALLETVVTQKPANLTLLLTSDHGNVEDLSTSHHTLNAVPLLAIGPEARRFSGVRDLTGITPAILDSLKR